MINNIKKTAVCALLLIGTISTSYASLVISSSQSANVSGKYIPPMSFDLVDMSNSYNGNNQGGISLFDFDLADKGIQNGSVGWDIGIEPGTVKSFSDLRLTHNFGNGSDFSDLHIDVSSRISYGDTVTIRDLLPNQSPVPNNLFVRFEVALSGNLFNIVNYNDPSVDGASLANYFSSASFGSTIGNSAGQANQDVTMSQTSSTHSNGVFNNNVNEFSVLNSSVIFEDLLWSHQAIFVDWSYSELFDIDIESIDAGSIDIHMQNDLGSTLITRASVFDENGNWLPNYVVESSGGFDYDNISNLVAPNPTPRPVNAPGTMSLFVLPLLGMFARRAFLAA
ncbi:MAG: hypothetical protein Alis3KO_02480 [Aliiglaciecola sp.]